MTDDQVRELIDILHGRHELKIAQLMRFLESEGGSDLFNLASSVLGDAVKAADWLTSGQIALAGATPASVALHAEGYEAVRTYLQQIEHSVFV